MQVTTNSNRVVFDKSLIAERNFWIERLAPLVDSARLNLDSTASRSARDGDASLDIVFNGDDYQKLVRLTGGKPFLVYTTLMTAMNVCLSRYNNSRWVVVGSPSLKEIDTANALAIASEVDAHVSFKDLLVSTRQTLLDAYERQRYPFDLLLRDLNLTNTDDQCPLFDVALSFNDIHGEMAATQNGLTITFDQHSDRLNGSITFNDDLYQREDVERFANQFVNALAAGLRDPGQSISDISLMSEAERTQIVEEWNQTEREYARDLCIHQLFERQAALTPDAIAVVCDGRQLSYDELNCRSNQLAHYLRHLGVGPESIVGVCMERSLEMVVSVMAILKSGAAYLPLDPAYPPQRVSFMIEDSGLHLLITQNPLRGNLPELDPATVFCIDSGWHQVTALPTSNPGSSANAENLAYVIYTSGSTGRPKGVQVEHQSAGALIDWALHTFPRESLNGVLASTSICFDLSVFELFVPLSVGGAVIVVENALALPELKSPVAVTMVNTVPSAMAQLVQTGGVPETVCVVNLAGEALTRRLAEQVYGLNHVEALFDLYGPTEDTVYSVWERVGRGETGPVLIGRPVSNTRAYIVDERMQVVPAGVSGELLLGGEGLARGYLRRAELTAERFIPDQFSGKPGERLYRTGDLCRYRTDGRIEYQGRLDHQVKLRGYRIELGEVEAAIEDHSSVRECVVVAREDSAGEKRLVCYLAPAHEVEGTDLREYLSMRLPEYMIPSQFVELEELPRTVNGKVDRKALPAPQWHSRAKQEYMAPRTPVEEKLAAIWADVLGLEQVGVHDNFFELGGDSIISIQVIARANQAGLQLFPRDLFQHQTVAKLAAVAGTGQAITAEQGLVSGAVELTPIQHWFFEQELTEAHHFNQALLLQVENGLDATALKEAAQQVLLHHDALRLRYEAQEGSWRQYHASEDEEVSFAVVNFSEVPASEQRARLEQHAAETQASLDLAAGPLLRLVCYELGAEQAGRLLIVSHHLVIDGVSWRILLEDLHTAYAQLTAGEQVQLPAKSSSFQQWSQALKEHAATAKVRAQADYWLSPSRMDVSDLPRDKAGNSAANVVSTSRTVKVSLSGAETQALLQEVPPVYHTQINEVLLTALALTLTKWQGSGRVLVDMEGHGREPISDKVDVSRTVGWFTTIYPVLLEVNGARRVAGEALKSIKEQLRQIPAQGIGYGLLRYLSDDVELRTALQALPQAEVSFNYLGQVDRVFADNKVFAAAGESAGSQHSPRGNRKYLLEIDSIITGGRLQLNWTYSDQVHHRETIDELAHDYLNTLQQIIRHCQSVEVGSYTPSDFPLAQLKQAELDQLINGRTGIEDLYPLSPMQQGMLFHSLYAPRSGMYFEQVLNRFEGDFNVEGLKYAWEQVLERHEVLRSSFQWEGLSWPVQVVHAAVKPEWVEEDWRELSAADRQEQLEQALRADQKRGFELREAPLMRFALLRTGDAEWQLIWSFHHILLDGWCIPLLMKEVYRCYEAYVSQEVLELDRPRLYRDYIEWLQAREMNEAEAYWRNKLAGFTAATSLVMAAPANAAHLSNSTYAEKEIYLAAETTSALDALARGQQVTLNTLVQGAWAMLLSRYSGERDVVFGATVSGRPAELAGVEEMVGLFVNSLPVRVRMQGEQRLGEWLQELQREQAEMRQYEYSPLVEVQGWSEVERGAPLFETLLAYENYPIEQLVSENGKENAGVRYKHLGAIERTNYPVTVVVMPGRKLLLKVIYEEQRLEAEAIERLLGHFEQLLESMTGGAEQQLSELRLLTAAEERQLLVEWNDTELSIADDVCAHRLFEQQAARTPDAMAVISDDGELTYGELDRRSNQLAHCLIEQGVGPEVLVGICMPRSLDLIVSMLAVLKAGGAYLPLDPEYPQERLAFMLDDASVQVLLTQLPESLQQYPETAPVANVTPRNLAYVIYTSGSTGKPKGVMVQHRSLMNLVSWHCKAFAVTPADRATQLASLAFDAAVWEMWPYLSTGASLYLLNQAAGLTPVQLRDWLLEREITICFLPTPLAETVLQIAWPSETQLRTLLVGGDKLHRYEDRGLPFTVVNNYGPTESTVVATSIDVTGSEEGDPSIGRPIANTRVYVVDAYGEVVPVGVSGELVIGGEGLARGYLQRAELTAERFIPDALSGRAGERLYRTGDLCRYGADGRLEYLGRIDQQVKVRGYRIELGEVEAAVASHGAVRECVVVAREERAGDKRLIGYVVLRDEAEQASSLSDLQEHVRKQLPEYMAPSQFVVMVQLPLTANGKVDRRALPSPEELKKDGELAESDAVRTPVEEILAGIWADVLGVEQVELSDNFFELGGHSLLATQIITRASESFYLDLPLSLLFEFPTLRQFASHVENMIGVEELVVAPAIERVSRDEELPLSFAQQRLWFLHQLDPQLAAYNITTAIELNGVLQVRALERSLAHLIRRHESLRTVFPMDKGRAVQQVLDPQPWQLAVDDLRDYAPETMAAEVRRRVTAEAAQPFDLSRGPLFRVKLLRTGEQQHVLVVVMHHIISDGWSMGVLRREVARLYEGYVRGEQRELAELPVQYADFAVWQREWLQGELLDQQLGYWKRQLHGVAPVLDLPTDRPRPVTRNLQGATQALVINKTLARSVKAFAQSQGVTLYMTLLAAFQLLLARYSRQDEIVTGSAIAGRNRRELEGLIGFFVNTLVLRADVQAKETVSGFLKQVRKTCLEAYAHQDVPFEKLVEELQPERNLSHQPLFQVMFSLQNAPREMYELPALTMSPVEFESRVAKFDLTFMMTETPNGPIYGVMEYSTELFDATTVARMLAQYERVLEGIIAAPQQKVLEVPLITKVEEQQLVVEWNETWSEYPRELSIAELFEQQAALRPDAVAVVYEGESLTYRELNERANQVAHYLLGKGVGPETLVGVCMQRSLEMVIALVGIVKAGGAYLPLDPEYPQARLDLMLEDAGAKIVLTQLEMNENRANPEPRISLDNLAYVSYTSGSTGRPKGVAVPQRGVLRLVLNTNYIHLNETDVVLQMAPLSFDASTLEVWAALLNGGRLVVMKAGRVTLAEIAEVLKQEQVTTLWLTAGLFHLMVNEQPEALTTVTKLLAGGDVLQPSAVEQMMRTGSGVLINGYGPTENTTFSCCHVMERGVGADLVTATVPIGRAVANTRVYVVDEAMQVVPVGVSGELLLGGEGLARGYLQHPELTAASFIPDPFGGEPGARLYRTGDVVRYRSNGELEFVGRRDEQVKIRGYRIELGEVELALASHPAVKESVVVARGSEDGGKRLIGYVVWREGESVSGSDLREYLGERLPEYMIPGQVVELDELPLNANGKVDRKSLPLPEEAGLQGAEYEAPRTAVEEILAGIWSKLLGLDPIGIHDNFFELGGDSIISIQAIARANQAGLQLSPKDLFQHQTIAKLAAVVRSTDSIHAEQGIVTGSVELTPIQHWFFEQQIVEPHHFNQSLLLQFRSQIDASVLREAAAHVVVHHDALRLRYQQTSDGWQQFHASADEAISFEVIYENTITAIETLAEETQASLSLSEGPLLRMVHFDLGTEQPARLLIVCHHLLVDGVSWRILLEDLQTAYTQLAAGERVQLPAKTTSFKQWTGALKDYSSSKSIVSQSEYWLDISRRSSVVLPRDYPAGENSISSLQTVNVALSAEETQALLQEVPAVYHTQINEVLLTALAMALTNWTHDAHVLIDMEGHGREPISRNVDVSRTVGWFTTIYPVLLEVDRAHETGEALKSIKEQLRQIPQQGIGYGLLRYLSANAEVSTALKGMPQAEVIFNYMGQVGRALGEESAFAIAPESSGSQRSSRGTRRHLLEISSVVASGRLQLSWIYSENVHRRATVEQLAHNYVEALQQIILHCQCEEAGGYTPSDFPLAQLSQEELDRVLAGRIDVEDVYRLTPMQQGMLFHGLYAPQSGLYFEQLQNRFEGEFDVAALKTAWQRVLERHEVLRSSYQWEGLSRPVQVVHASAAPQWVEEDWRELDRETQQQKLARFVAAERERGFDFTQAPLLRFALLRLGDAEWQFVWSFHHILLDGWCMSLLMQEVLRYYAAYTSGAELKLAQPRPYRDYIEWLKQQDIKEAEAYWRQRLAGFTSPTPLGIAAAADVATVSNRAEQQRYLTAKMTSELEALARRQQVTLNTVVQGAWAMLLSRYSGERDVVFGATVSGRPAELAGVEEMIGLFINSLPVRVRVRGDIQLGEWLQELQREQAEMRQYEYSPLVEVQGWSDVERGVPLFESLLAYENYPVEQLAPGASESVARVRYEQAWAMERTNYPLTLVVGPGRKLLLKALYEEQRIETEAIGRLLDHLEQLLESMTRGAQQQLSELRLLTATEERQLVVEWNETWIEYPRELSIAELFEQQAALRPDAVAVVYEGEQLTYRELNERANQVAHYLLGKGVGPETLVGICMQRSLEMVIALVGIVKAGGAYLPLDPEYPQARIDLMLEDAGAKIVLTQLEMNEHRANPETRISLDNLAYVSYTSGSTGRPKGVAIPQRGVLRLVLNTNYIHLDETDVVLQMAPLSFDASTLEVWGALLNGGRLVVVKAGRVTLAEIAEVLKREQVTTLWLTAGLFHLMVNEQPEALTTVTKLLAGGDVLQPSAVEQMMRTGSGVLINGYGPTENTTFSCCHVMQRGVGADMTTVTVPIGRAVANTRVYVVDEAMQVVPVGVSGELLLGGEGLARGYLQHPEITATSFIPDPFSGEPGARLYRTGDVVRYRSNGDLEFVGRRDEQVKIRGYRIELGEVELALASHPAVKESVVVARSGGLIGYVVWHEAESVSASELRDYLGERLPEYMIPGQVVELDELPLNANGKVDRKSLPLPEAVGLQGAEYEAPGTPVEQILAGIWADVLGVERVGVHDNFFELGGHSLKATQIVSRVRDTFKVELPLRRLFEEALTVAALAELVEESKDRIVEVQEPSIVPIARDAYRTSRSSLTVDATSYGD